MTSHIHDQILNYLIDKHPDKNLTARDIFFNPSKKSLRLTVVGVALMKRDFDHERLDLPDKYRLIGKHILQLERTMNWPYYVNVRSSFLILFNDDDRVIFKLVGGFEAWVANL